MSALASNGSKNAATTNLTEADRANRLFRMRSKISRNEKDASSMPRFEAQDAAKLVRSRLNADETASLRAAFSMFASAKDADKLKTKKLWSVMRALGLAPTPLEFEKLAKDMDKRENGVIKWSDFLKEMERFMTQYFSKAQDMERAFAKVCKLAGDDGVGAVTVDELTVAMTNLGFKLPDDKDDAEEEVFEMIGEVDSKGTGEIDLDDFIKMVSVQLGELPGEASS